MTQGPETPAGLVVSLLAAQEDDRTRALAGLRERFGPTAVYSEPLAFTPDYYAAEMGGPLTRRVALMDEPVASHGLAGVKRGCMELEAELSRDDGRRRVNLDPGLISAGGLWLATHKPAPHRLALEPGLYAELTLWFHAGGFEGLPWTYLDYASPPMRELMAVLRRRHLWRLGLGRQGETSQ